MGQIARTELGVENVLVLPADTQVGSAGSSCASRQTHMTGGAVQAACTAVREEWERAAARSATGIEETREYHHRPTQPLDEHGQGDAHVTFAFAAHRAVVDVDTELGLVRVVEIATAQDVGKAMNPLARRGPDRGRHRAGPRAGADGGDPGRRRQGAQRVLHRLPDPDDPRHAAGELDVLELGDPDSPYGLRGVGEPPTISSTPAIVAALRAATGRELLRGSPCGPDEMVGPVSTRT